MSNSTGIPRPPENQILAALPAVELERLWPKLQAVELEQGQVLYEANVPVQHVYFIDQGMISVVSIMQNGASIEVGAIGNEGIAGKWVILGVESVPYRHVVQVSGQARRMSADSLVAEVKQDRVLRRLLYRYHAAFSTQIMQGM